MLDSFRKRDSKPGDGKSGYPRAPQSPYGEMQAALSPAKGGTETTKSDTRSDATSVELRSTSETRSNDSSSLSTEKGNAVAGEHNVSKLIVGPDIKLKGAEITDCDTLVVEGRVEASMDSRVIQIAQNGVFVGKVDIDVAEIRGRFEGELVARKQLVIHSTGHVSGTIRYGKITVEEGGELLGDVAALTTNGTAKTASSASKMGGSSSISSSANTGEFAASDSVGALFKAAGQR